MDYSILEPVLVDIFPELLAADLECQHMGVSVGSDFMAPGCAFFHKFGILFSEKTQPEKCRFYIIFLKQLQYTFHIADKTILHAGPPIEFARMCAGHRRSMVNACLFE